MTSSTLPSLDGTPVDATTTAPTQALVFVVAGCDLALPLSSIREIVPPASLLTPPGLPAVLEGLLLLGDFLQAIPVLRPDRLFGLQASVPLPGLYTPILLIHNTAPNAGVPLLGLLVEQAQGIYRLSEEALSPLPEGSVFADSARAQLALPDGRNVTLLAPERLLLREEQERLGAFVHEAERRRSVWEAETA